MEENLPKDDDNQSESDWSADNDSSSTSLIEVTHHLEIDRYIQVLINWNIYLYDKQLNLKMDLI